MAKKQPTDGPVTVRLLLDQTVGEKFYKGDTLLVLPPGVAQALCDMFAADDGDEAVAYLKSQGVEPVMHEA